MLTRRQDFKREKYENDSDYLTVVYLAREESDTYSKKVNRENKI